MARSIEQHDLQILVGAEADFGSQPRYGGIGGQQDGSALLYVRHGRAHSLADQPVNNGADVSDGGDFKPGGDGCAHGCRGAPGIDVALLFALEGNQNKGGVLVKKTAQRGVLAGDSAGQKVRQTARTGFGT